MSDESKVVPGKRRTKRKNAVLSPQVEDVLRKKIAKEQAKKTKKGDKVSGSKAREEVKIAHVAEEVVDEVETAVVVAETNEPEVVATRDEGQNAVFVEEYDRGELAPEYGFEPGVDDYPTIPLQVDPPLADAVLNAKEEVLVPVIPGVLYDTNWDVLDRKRAEMRQQREGLMSAGTLGATPGQGLADTLLETRQDPPEGPVTLSPTPPAPLVPPQPAPDQSARITDDKALDRLQYIANNPGTTVSQFNAVFDLGSGAVPYLKDMERQGLVRRDWIDSEGRYTLTVEGHILLHD